MPLCFVTYALSPVDTSHRKPTVSLSFVVRLFRSTVSCINKGFAELRIASFCNLTFSPPSIGSFTSSLTSLDHFPFLLPRPLPCRNTQR